MTQQNQILALEKSRKTKVENAKSTLYKAVQKTALFSGLTRTYKPYVDGDEVLPSETTLPTHFAGEVLAEFNTAMAALVDLVATKDATNRIAVADIVVNGPDGPVALVEGVAVTTLLMLEKQLTDWRTMILAMPVHDMAERWTYDPNRLVYVSEESATTRQKRVKKVVQLAPPTAQHKEQAEVYDDAENVGTWTTVKFSTALPAAEVKAYMDRIDTLIEAVKSAREVANQTVAVDRTIADRLVGYVMAPVA